MFRPLVLRTASRGSIFCLMIAAGSRACEPSATTAELGAVFASISPSVVRIAIEPTGHSGVGTIVSSEGHVIVHAIPHLKSEPLLFIFADGRRANGKLLGWSEEWNISLAKITDEGIWPAVEMVSDQQIPRVNDTCFTIGYTLEATGWKTSPCMRRGRVTDVGAPFWFVGSIRGNTADEPYFAFEPVFNTAGKLLGIKAVEQVVGDSIQLHAHQIQTLWKQLSQGGNVDEMRLLHLSRTSDVKRPYIIAALNAGHATGLQDARQTATSCTVRLRKPNGELWSGVIISPDGWIATCGHGGQRAGQKVTVELSDGRNAAARVLGANPITDIALIKTNDDGPWPFAALCDTSHWEGSAPCLVVGYPSEKEGRRALVRKTKVIVPKDGAEWSHLFYTDASYEQYGGDSGGGVFDMSGRLLGITQGKEPGNPGRHVRIEVLRVQWDLLAGNRDAR